MREKERKKQTDKDIKKESKSNQKVHVSCNKMNERDSFAVHVTVRLGLQLFLIQILYFLGSLSGGDSIFSTTYLRECINFMKENLLLKR